MNDVAFLDATAQAELVRNKQVKPEELLDGAIERIERLDPQLNNIVLRMYDQAKAAIAAGLPDGPFTGVPFLVKDLGTGVMCQGTVQAQGSRFLASMVSPMDTEITRRYKAAGLVLCAKTNTPEFGLLPTTESELCGPAHNPWNLDHTTGGSSGGSAASVAAGIVPMAHANDGGGSIRIPASCCGIFGLKPTRARVTQGPLVGDIMSGLTIDHCVSRSVRDSAALLDASMGPMLGDPYVAPEPERPYIEEVGAHPGTLRIAFTTKTYNGPSLHEDCVAAVKDAAALLQDLGHEVEEADPPVPGEQLIQSFTQLWAAGNAWGIDSLAMLTGREPKQEDFEILTWALYEMGKEITAVQYLNAVSAMQMLGRQMAMFHQRYDIWLTPTLGAPPVELGYIKSTPEEPMLAFQRSAEFVPFTPIQNATGQPAMSVPLYWNDDGLPIGTHFVGRFGDEATLYRLAAQLEEARPWAGKIPPVHA
ncbi:MAG TPA: amidase family protein [Dehalococcoidia bacterium]|nr:amidase family protein [Dehalococcoidia bacterium]